jgi:hypothetical protein
MSKFSFNPSEVSISFKKNIIQSPVSVTMELEKHEPRYMARFRRYEPLIKDSHATKVYKQCPKMYFLQIVLGFNSPEKFVIFAWGSAYHKFREVLERTYGFGSDKPPQFDADKAREALIAGTLVGLEYWRKHGEDQEPGSKWGFMTADRLLLSFKRAYTHWQREKEQNQIEVVAVEQAFNVQLRDGSRTSGRFDQLVRWLGVLWNRDFKSTTKDSAFYARQLDPNDQFTRYTLAGSYLAGEPVQGAIVELLYNNNPTRNKTHGPDIFPLTTSRTKEQLDTFEKEVTTLNRKLAINRELDVWEKNEGACAFCPYHSVCTQPSEEAEMEKLEQHFIVRPWDNTKVGVTED